MTRATEEEKEENKKTRGDTKGKKIDEVEQALLAGLEVIGLTPLASATISLSLIIFFSL